MVGEIDERSGADRDQDIGSQARAALPVLALGANQRSEHERDHQADEGIEEIERQERVQESLRTGLGARSAGPSPGLLGSYSQRH